MNNSTGRPTASVSLALDYITQDPRLQSRPLKPDRVKAYAAAMRRGEVFPPVQVVCDRNGNYYLVDGYHRVAATRQLNGIDVIEAEIIEGTLEDALWLCWAANRNHGLARTQKEKRAIVRAALLHPEWSKKSDREIGRHVGCDHKTVAAIRRFVAGGEIPKPGFKARGRAPHWSPRKTVLGACWMLAEVPPEQRYRFDDMDLPLIKSGLETLQRLLLECQPQLEVATQLQECAVGAMNA